MTIVPELTVISVVDDDAPLREAIVCLMRSLGHDARSFASAEEFLLSPYVDATSCLIADVQMPGMSGFELQQSLLAKGRNIPTIFISAFPGERLKAKTAPDPVCFLSKPFDTKALVDCLEKALEKNSGAGSGLDKQL
jgi:FixJ family two-component response regulator